MGLGLIGFLWSSMIPPSSNNWHATSYGKASRKLVGALLVFLGVADLIVPAYSLIGYNTLPF
jgi:hypothetical protein